MTYYDIESIDEERWDQWLQFLVNTHLQQAQGTLCQVVDGHVTVERLAPDNKTEFRYCCLGLGTLLIPDGIEIMRGAHNLAPREFIEWLGIVTELNLPEDRELTIGARSRKMFDLVVDLPEDLSKQGKEEDQKYLREVGHNSIGPLVASQLNDDGFTFSQIADVFRYFGLRAVSCTNG